MPTRGLGIGRWRELALVLLLAASVAACARGSKEMMAEDASLYDRLGGKDAITLVVDQFVANVAADDRINGRFAGSDLDRLEAQLVDQICEASGGPCTYTGEDMRTVHAGMNITDAEFSALVEDLVAALNQYNVPEQEQNELLSALGGMKDQIVGV
jgi:hemoglobin